MKFYSVAIPSLAMILVATSLVREAQAFAPPRIVASSITSRTPGFANLRQSIRYDRINGEVEDDTSTTLQSSASDIELTSGKRRFLDSLPRIGRRKDELDDNILKTAIPNMINLGVVPLVNAVDTFWVGRLGLALALAGQSAANQASFTIFFLISFLPNIMTPLVASAVASGNEEEAQRRVCESIFLCTTLGLLGTGLLVAFPKQVLSALVLPGDAPAMAYAAPYLRWRAIGMVPSLISATGFAAYRGMLNTVTPLKVSLFTNAMNLVLDPLCMFGGGLGFLGAAVATAASETLGGLTYLRLLLRKGLARWSILLKPPSWKSLLPLLQGGAAMLFRQLTLNGAFLIATRRAQVMDPTGISGAAYGIATQISNVGIILMVAMQSTTAALVPASMAKEGPASARKCADRLMIWSTLMGIVLAVVQYASLPFIVPIFSTLPEVREAVKLPAFIASLTHILDGPIFAGEGVMMGLGSYRDLAIITGIWALFMVGGIMSPFGQRLDGIMWTIFFASIIAQISTVGHYLKIGPLANLKKKKEMEMETAPFS
ncbi:unnamed protein product [Cylindrotheca closterium]|uniref:Protein DETOXIFICATION n=1 Tax=Cylindrotheca closterium TaxID=2856 RepID=A0AAD2FWI0_9STRA|nr:unnamed protein product [Cylindrotheca closterium]